MKKKLLALLLCVAMLLPSVAYAAPFGSVKFSTSAVKNLVSAAAEEEEAPAVEETPALDGSDKVKVDDGNTVSVEGIPTNAELSIGEPTKKSLRAITKAAEADNMDPSNSLFAYDISIVDENGDEWQPDGSAVLVKMTIPELNLKENEVVKIMHNHDGEVEIIDAAVLEDGKTIVFRTTGFSTYVAVYVDGKYAPQKMSTILEGNDRYSIKTFAVDLFDYNPTTINNALNGIPSDGNGFHFTGYGVTGCGSNSGINNSTAGFAKQGVLETMLVNGIPDIKYLADTADGKDAGVESGKLLFSATDYTDIKTIYNDIPFEFIYDNETGFYEYKSSANHAQLNGNRLELYADTLSTQNSFVATIDLSTAYGISDYINAVDTATSFSATATDSSGTVGRLDPYVAFTAPVNADKEPTVSASDVGFVYVKAKVPANVGANAFQLFFSSTTGIDFNETNSYVVSYTPNGDWIEFLIDTSDIPGWAGNLKTLRVDLFDSKWDDSTLDAAGNYDVEIAQVSLIRKNYDEYATRGGFYPFSEIEDSHPGNNTKFTLEAWETVFKQDGMATTRASRSIYNPAPNPATLLYDELAYGMVMEYDFYIPVDKTGDDLTYYFNGDDDLWVFVDGKLALDIGGGHGAITGTLNFSTGDMTVDSAVTVTGYNSGVAADQTTGNSVAGKMADELYAPGKHTMKIFYLERGGSVSNCFMKFNLPQTPEGSVTVSKDVVETADAAMDVLSAEGFEFTIELKNNGTGSDYKEKAPLANKSFYIVASDESAEEATTDANGKFYLKDGQKAVFEISENYYVTVTESLKQIPGYEGPATKVNGKDAVEDTLLTAENQEKRFDFVNTYTEMQETLTYIPVNPDGCPEDMKGTVELTGNTATKTSDTTGVSETIGKRVGIPAGSTATESNAVAFVGWYADAACTQLISEDPAFVPTKPAGSNLWESATYYAKFEFKYGDLKITKSGISDVDHHAQTQGGTHKEENQTTIFTVEGTSYSGQVVNMDVVIVGNSSTTINSLPVGEYTVTEKTDWSWRYTPDSNERTVEVAEEQTTETAYQNGRTNANWLSGDNWIQNLLSMNSGN